MKVDLLSKAWCDLVFEGRNKDYGAYVLRRDHGRYLLYGLCGALLLLFLLFVPPLLYWGLQRHLAQQEALKSVTNLSELDEIEALRQKNLRAVATAVRPRMRVNKAAIRFRPSIAPDAGADLLVGTDALSDENDAESAAAQTDVVEVPDSLAAYENETDPATPDQAPTALQVVEEMPQFPGGLGALMRWLDRNIHYPAYCVQNKIEGEVRVSFIVDKNGRIVEPQVVQDVHPFLDREALRCVRRMPHWQPGRVHGKVSMVRVTIPVVFSLE